MGRQRYTRQSKGIVENTEGTVCGSVHPLFPQLTCISMGRCVIDSHIGRMKHADGTDELVVWGEFFEHAHVGMVKSAFRVVPLKEG